MVIIHKVKAPEVNNNRNGSPKGEVRTNKKFKEKTHDRKNENKSRTNL